MALQDSHLPSQRHERQELPERGSLRSALAFGAALAVTAAGYGLSLLTLPRDDATAASQDIHEMGHMMTGETSPQAAGRPTTVFKPLSCQKLPNVPGKSMTVALVEFPPNAYTPRHRHPGSVMAFVIKGTLRSQLEGEPSATYDVGQTWFEPPGAVHLFAENASKTEPAEILATFIADDDCGALTIPD